MKFLLLALFFALPASPSEIIQSNSREITVSGVVINGESKQPLAGVRITAQYNTIKTTTDSNGEFEISLTPGSYIFEFAHPGFTNHTQKIRTKTDVKNLIITLHPVVILQEEVITIPEDGRPIPPPPPSAEIITLDGIRSNMSGQGFRHKSGPGYQNMPFQNNEEYGSVSENIFHRTQSTPLSTFSIDVDAASYSNVRRIIMDGYLPPADAVRIEEMINYFRYNYRQPTGEDPFAVHTEIGAAPWNPEHQLVKICIQGEQIEAQHLPPSNLVFLLDVSGSMNSYDKLPLLKKGFKLLVNNLREEDYVSIVVYAGKSGLVLPPTSGFEKEKILSALENLRSGGSTAGAAGIRQAYDLAKVHFREGANNRVILATDGDFNVGVSGNEELIKLIEEKRNDGIFLSVLGFGTGNLKDSKMEQIANHGNGNYYYIDNLLEAKKVLVSEMGGTLHTIAKDVKIQVEFNPANVQAYRLIGYENRLLDDQDFNDDAKDAGELGAGHTVTALYEIIPTGIDADKNITDVDPLKYQTPKDPAQGFEEEIMTVKLRYKQPDGDTSKLLKTIVQTNQVKDELSEDLFFAASVAAFGMLLRDSEFKGNSTYDLITELAEKGRGPDKRGYRAEFLKIVELAELISQGQSSN